MPSLPAILLSLGTFGPAWHHLLSSNDLQRVLWHADAVGTDAGRLRLAPEFPELLLGELRWRQPAFKCESLGFCVCGCVSDFCRCGWRRLLAAGGLGFDAQRRDDCCHGVGDLFARRLNAFATLAGILGHWGL